MNLNPTNTVTQERIDALLEDSSFESVKLGPKTTVVQVTLPNGFAITETSSCVDPRNYDHELGVTIATKRAVEKVWMLEGYLMQQRQHEEGAEPIEPEECPTELRCGHVDCLQPATHEAHWPGTRAYRCKEHLWLMQQVAEAMGFGCPAARLRGADAETQRRRLAALECEVGIVAGGLEASLGLGEFDAVLGWAERLTAFWGHYRG